VQGLKGSTIVRAFAVVLPFLAGCASFGEGLDGFFSKQPQSGPGQIDELLDRIERVHVDCELAGKSVSETLGHLQTMTARDFKGDPGEAYTRFLAALELSEQRAEELGDSIGPMRAAAEPFFARWSASLADYTNAELRRHSQQRLLETRQRYQEIVEAVEPAQATLEAYNRALRDHALFLGHDYNPGAVTTIQGELRSVAKLAVDVGQQLEASRKAARAYVESSSLPVTVEPQK
jgi:hypothetical protein